MIRLKLDACQDFIKTVDCKKQKIIFELLTDSITDLKNKIETRYYLIKVSKHKINDYKKELFIMVGNMVLYKHILKQILYKDQNKFFKEHESKILNDIKTYKLLLKDEKKLREKNIEELKIKISLIENVDIVEQISISSKKIF